MRHGAPRRVLVLEDDVELCELLAIFLDTLEVECLPLHRFSELIAHRTDVLACQSAILDVNLGPGEPNGIAALSWLRSNGYPGKVVFLTGHARGNPLLNQLERAGIAVLAKPVSVEELAAHVRSSVDDDGSAARGT